MKSLITIAVALAIMNVTFAQAPTSGNFVFNSFSGLSCAGANTQSIFSAEDSSCWDLSSLFGLYAEATDFSNHIVAVNTYAAAGCTGNSASSNVVCDGTCQPSGADTSFTCNYSDFPDMAHANYTYYSDLECATVSIPNRGYNATDCWVLDGLDSGFPTEWNSTTQNVTFSTWGNQNCGRFASAGSPGLQLTCDGNCHHDDLHAGSYQCTYSNSAKLVVSLIITFVLMLVLA